MKKKSIARRIVRKLKKMIAGNEPGKAREEKAPAGSRWDAAVRKAAAAGPTESAYTSEQEKCIKSTMKKTGWSRDMAIEQMDDARARLGISYSEYDKNDFCTLSEEEQNEKYSGIVANRQKKSKRMEERQKRYVREVMEKTGWTREHALEEMHYAEDHCGISFEYFNANRFWEIDKDTWNEYYSKGQADMLRATYNVDPKLSAAMINKGKFCRKYGKYLGRKWLLTEDSTLDTFKKTFSGVNKIIYKPLTSTGGSGICVFELNSSNMDDVYREITELPPGILEEYLVQHHEMNKMSLHAVNTIRIVTIMTEHDVPGVENIEKGKVYILYAAARFATGDSVTDNLHSGGMVAALDAETGEVVTNAVDFKYNVNSVHPDTGEKIMGFRIPYFKEAIKMVTEAASVSEGYFGWDVAITEHGPVIIEGNTHPGAGVLQTPYVPHRKGMRYVVEPFLPKLKRTEPEMPYGTKISAISDAGIEYYWKKPERANGYVIYRGYEPDGEFKEIARYNKRTVGDHTDSKFKHSADSVYYRIASYVNNPDGTKSFSEMTEPVKAEPRKELATDRNVIVMYSGAERQLNAYIGWGNCEDAVWTSEDPSVAEVTESGLVTAVAKGSCNVKCRRAGSDEELSVQIIVDREAPEPLAPVVSRFEKDEETGIFVNKAAEKTGNAIIMMAGDMMCGSRQIKEQRDEDGGCNFNESYEYVRKVTALSDFAIGNLETLLAAGWPYMTEESYIENKNNCNAPARYLDAVRYGGFDAVSLSNNHNCDGGPKALIETIDQVDKYGLINTGVFRNADEDRFFIVDINGIKVGFLAFMSRFTGFNGKDRTWTSEEKKDMLNIFSPKRAAEEVEACRKAGAEYIVAYMHWGIKNFFNPTDDQLREARQLANAGVDYIAGSNPHVIQPFEIIVTQDNRVVPCAYSIGNFHATMNQVTGNRDSMMLRIVLERDNKGKVVLKENTYIPFTTYNRLDGHRWPPVPVSKNYDIGAKRKDYREIRNRIIAAAGRKIDVR